MPTGTKAPIPIGYSKVEALGTFGPATWANVFYIDTTPSDPSAPNDAMAAARLAIHELMGTFQTYASTTWSVARERVTYRADADSTYSATIADGIGGLVSGGYQDAQVAFLLNWVTGDARKGGKPRQYFVGVPDTAVADSARIQGSVVSAFNADIATWLAGFPYDVGSGVANELVEMSFVNAKAYRTDPFPTSVVAGTVNPVVATQRRRVDRLRG